MMYIENGCDYMRYITSDRVSEILRRQLLKCETQFCLHLHDNYVDIAFSCSYSYTQIDVMLMQLQVIHSSTNNQTTVVKLIERNF